MLGVALGLTWGARKTQIPFLPCSLSCIALVWSLVHLAELKDGLSERDKVGRVLPSIAIRMAGGSVSGDKAMPGLSTSHMSTQPHLFRSHTGVLARGIGREPLLSSASTQELEEAWL